MSMTRSSAAKGVFRRAWTRPKREGTRPQRPSEKTRRVETLVPALAHTNSEFTRIRNSATQPTPHRCLVMPVQGSPLLYAAKAPMRAGPKYTVAA